jgi:kumamolisin
VWRVLVGFAVLCTVCALAPAALAAGRGDRANGGFAQLGSAPAAQQLALVLPLRADIAGLERFAGEVTTVGSPIYGDYEPLAALERRFGALASERVRVLKFLRRAGATDVKIDATGLFADATMRVSLAQRVFGTSLARFETARASSFVAPSGGSRVPSALKGAVTGVIGLNTRPVFSSPVTSASASAAGRVPLTASNFGADNVPSGYSERTGSATGCAPAIVDRGFTPNQYLTAYDYAALQSQGITGQGERVALIEIDGFRYSDLKAFAGCFDLPVPAINGYGVGLKHPLAAGGETTLDLEVLDAAAPGLKEVDVYESRATASSVLESLTAPLQNRGHVPDVISASLGTCEPVLRATIGRSGAREAEAALALAAASGISVLASSGDAGSSACIGRDGPIDALAVSYPASSPYVTGVGGTNALLTSANALADQTVWNDAPYDVTAGGGGYSGLFTRPSYQHGLVSRNRRAVPDISMLADVLPGYDIYCTAPECLAGNSGPWIAVGGTSAASPLLAGGLALIDQLLRTHGKQNLGLANSLLYKVAKDDASSGAIVDVTTNDNDLGPYLPGGGHHPLGCCSAHAGFDLASGLGTVDLGKLAFLATGMQPAISKVKVSLPSQRPVARGYLTVKLRCNGRCVTEALAQIKVAGGRSFAVASESHVLGHASNKTVKLRFTHAQLATLRRALHHHRKVTALVSGRVTDAGGNLEYQTASRALRIRG